MSSEKPVTLHADAKEFVPSFLKATTSAPPAKTDASKTSASAKAAPKETAASKVAKGAPAASKNGANSTASTKTSSTPSASTAATVVKQVPKAPAPVKAAWGSTPSAAVKTAAPIKPQQVPPAVSAQRQGNKQQGGNQKQSQQHQRGGQRGGNGGGGGGGVGKDSSGEGWKRGEQAGEKKSDNALSTGSWARAASKPGVEGINNKGGNNRQNSSRGGNNDGEQGDNKDGSWSRGKVLPVELLNPGEGKTDTEKAVKRISVDDLLAMRLDFMDAPASWSVEESKTKPPPACLWDTPTRVSEIEESSKAERTVGDVVIPPRGKRNGPKKNPNDTAPLLEDCKPIEVNEETRWKAKVFEGKEGEAAAVTEGEDSKEEVIRKALLILNKLSLTKFDKLSDEFINCGIGRDVECLTEAVSLIVNKAQEEQHFSSMYAGLCLKLAGTPFEGIDDDSGKKGKKFKKILLQRCQDEFETETSAKIEAATKDITDEEEIAYHANLLKKHYLGHMRFIGELYKGDMISIKIMLFCLPQLLMGEASKTGEISDEVDEEKIECFAKLMTVIGSSLEQQSEAMKSVGKVDAADNLAACWKTVEIMAGKRPEDGPKVSNRIKFMLQDLLEMKSKGE